MKTNKHTKIIFAAFLILAVNISFASFTGSGTVDAHYNTKFSLKNFNKLAKNYSLYSLKLSQFQFKGSRDLSQVRLDNTITVQSMIRLENGNTTYVYPYKYKVRVPKFKTPTPPAFR